MMLRTAGAPAELAVIFRSNEIVLLPLYPVVHDGL
jgi:hypothetical protein